MAALVAELSDRDPDFRVWWDSHQVRGPRALRKSYRHPIAGPITLDVQQFTVDTHPGQLLMAYTAEPGTSSEQALRFLLQLVVASGIASRDHRGRRLPGTSRTR